MEEVPSEVQRLEQLGITAYLKDVTTLVLENRPEAPIEFIADYFRNATKGGTGMSRCYRYIRMTQRHRDAFMDNLLSAFTSLDSKLHNSAGLTGRDYATLLRLLCNDFPLDIVDSLLAVMGKTANDAIDFQSFCAGINACLLYEEFFEQIEWLFKSCDTDGSGFVDKRTFQKVVDGMKNNQRQALESAAEDKRLQMPSPSQIETAMNLAIKDAARRPDNKGGENRFTFKGFVHAIFRTTELTVPGPVKSKEADDDHGEGV